MIKGLPATYRAELLEIVTVEFETVRDPPMLTRGAVMTRDAEVKVKLEEML
jgi:hypothetical protein